MIEDHPTKEILINSAVDLIQTKGWPNVTSDLVLEASRVSKGSMYYHFKDFHELIEVAQVRIYDHTAAETIAELNTAFENSETKADFFSKIPQIMYGKVEPQLNESRLAQAEVVALALASPRMHEHVGEVQSRINSALVELLTRAQKRGWANPELDPLAMAMFLQAYNFGSVIDLLSESRVEISAWIRLVNLVLDEVLLNGEG
ncbi:MAG: TetR/AcrR family transcriptional regulator [Actinomycetes bacterium]